MILRPIRGKRGGIGIGGTGAYGGRDASTRDGIGTGGRGGKRAPQPQHAGDLGLRDREVAKRSLVPGCGLGVGATLGNALDSRIARRDK
eukprot:scaffold182276_cov24-Tisochrysis_lutea.AAC.1